MSNKLEGTVTIPLTRFLELIKIEENFDKAIEEERKLFSDELERRVRELELRYIAKKLKN